MRGALNEVNQAKELGCKKSRAQKDEEQSPAGHKKTSPPPFESAGGLEILFDFIVTRTNVLVKRKKEKQSGSLKRNSLSTSGPSVSRCALCAGASCKVAQRTA